MPKKLSSLSAPWKVGLACVLAVGLAWSAGAIPSSNGPVWNEAASQEVKAALHHMHEIWNTGDIRSLRQYIVGDDVLVTFELDPATHQPIRLTSREELFAFVDAIARDLEGDAAVSLLSEPKLNCRATDSFGICTEECAISVKTPDGVEERHKLWSTATAVRYDDGWKWIQWHMSLAAPIETYKDGKRVATAQ